MKFTPETLLQIYLDGSFTDEAQAEFDALMRRDPAFAEKVTQALSERLGPVPEELVSGVSASLDAKIGGIWNQYKPSPVPGTLKWGAKAALILGAAGGLLLAGRLLVAKLTAPPAAGVPASISGSLPDYSTTVAKAPESAGSKVPSSVSHPENPAPVTRTNGISVPMTGNLSTGKRTAPPSSNSLNRAPAVSAPPSLSAPNQDSQASAGGATAEGNSLRVAIDLEQSEKVDVTVFDSNGLLVRHLYNGPVAAGEHYVDWDGKDQLGNAVLPGDYTVILDRGGKKMSGILKVLPPR